jgi:hypothetical protein
MGALQNAENTDSRLPGDWNGTYQNDAISKINFEARYLVIIYLLSIISTLVIWTDLPIEWFGFSSTKYAIFKKFSLVFFGGAFGGTIFDFKWLIHAVAKRKWHMDRRLWRLLVPLISGAFSLAFSALISSGLIRVFDANSLNTPAAAFGFGFLVGYFSDNAIAKLSEVAQTLFGTLEDKHKKTSVNPPHSSNDVP